MTDTLFSPEVYDLAKRVIDENKAIGRRVTVAESCTGGLVSGALTEVPGSSAVFQCGFTTYADEAKIAMLDVAPDLIEVFGAVSMAVAWGMAQGALAKSDADVAVAISGVAGPGGGSPNKPVGTVVFAKAKRGDDPEQIHADRKDFGEDKSRAEIRRQAVICALELLLPDAP
ncbi:CinA family protein [Novosphingopyxis iocasae]|uniref:CinA family protein n=1 Tax=Novosphingopyxis iocasae TaxID=2762729 RepID=UPI001650F760|nr:CinA family protein [Novosphingopyxis iocasae]|tara:strand:- start:45 stop:560 length:516 start_codon:yes stop_codon:yes gene_type:complete